MIDNMPPLDDELVTLAEEAWRQFDAPANHCLVKPSMPILFFGDLKAYQNSDLRVVTVGLNPSKVEFPGGNPFQRFAGFSQFSPHGEISSDFVAAYIRALSRYFKGDPYKGWFGPDVGFEPVLRGLGASFYRGRNVALHTDICSPLATCPTWKGLDDSIKDSLREQGTPLWHSLIGYLKPDVMLVALGRDRWGDIGFECASKWEDLHTVGRTRRNQFGVPRYKLEGGKSLVALFGGTAQTPYGTVSAADKQTIGELLREVVLG